MAERSNRIAPALRHGIYSGMALLPGEDRAEYEKFHRDIITEYKPAGRSEENIVTNVADLMWRRQNLAPFATLRSARRCIRTRTFARLRAIFNKDHRTAHSQPLP
jgi:hypothetical protein